VREVFKKRRFSKETSDLKPRGVSILDPLDSSVAGLGAHCDLPSPQNLAQNVRGIDIDVDERRGNRFDTTRHAAVKQ
jgi:hypothetical protein